MSTLRDTLDKAIAIYIIDLDGNMPTKSLTFRASAYALTKDGEMNIIWPDIPVFKPDDTDKRWNKACEKSAKESGFTINNRNRHLPKYHFASRGYGYDKVAEVLNTIQRLAGRRIPGFLLSGHSPSPISNLADPKLDNTEK